MPNKTIYIRDADLPLWDLAQKKLGESLSSVFVDYLKERLKEKIDMVQAMDVLLAEINIAHGLEIERHPSHSPLIPAQDTDKIGYKLHQRRANPDRVMSLVVDPFSFDGQGQLNSKTKKRIASAITKFWDGKCSDRHKFVDATV